jgi:hypothetical protein
MIARFGFGAEYFRSLADRQRSSGVSQRAGKRPTNERPDLKG